MLSVIYALCRSSDLQNSSATRPPLKRGSVDAHYVGFESVNTATNVGPTEWNRESGLVSLWSLGQFPASDQTAIIVPYKPGSEEELGPVVQADYFGTVPPIGCK